MQACSRVIRIYANIRVRPPGFKRARRLPLPPTSSLGPECLDVCVEMTFFLRRELDALAWNSAHAYNFLLRPVPALDDFIIRTHKSG
jgi:hypothetical protein